MLTNATSGTDGAVTIDADLIGNGGVAKENLTISAGSANVTMLDRVGEVIGNASSIGNVDISGSTLVFLDSINATGNIKITAGQDVTIQVSNGIDAGGDLEISGVNITAFSSLTADGDIRLTTTTGTLATIGANNQIRGTDVLLKTNSIDWDFAINSATAGGNVTFATATGTTAIDVGADTPASGLLIDQSLLDLVGAGFSTIIIGEGAAQTGQVVVSADGVVNTNVHTAVASLTIDAVNIQILSDVLVSNSGSDLTIGRTNATVTISANASLGTNAGTIALRGITEIDDNVTLSLNSAAINPVLGADIELQSVSAAGTGSEANLVINAANGNVFLGTLNSHTIGTAALRLDELKITSATNVFATAAMAFQGVAMDVNGDVFLTNTLNLASEVTGQSYALFISASNISLTNASNIVTGASTENLQFTGLNGGDLTMNSGVLDLSNSPLAQLIVNGNFASFTLGADIKTAGTFIQINTPVLLIDDVTIETNGGDINIASNLRSNSAADSLTLDAGGAGLIDTQDLGSASNPLNGLQIIDADTVTINAINSNFGVDINAGSIVILGTVESSGDEIILQSYDGASLPAILLNSLDSNGENVTLIAQQQISLVGGVDSITSSVAGASLSIRGTSVGTPMFLGINAALANQLRMNDASIAAIGNGFTAGIEFGSVGQTASINVQGATQSFGNRLTYHLEGGAPLLLFTDVDTVANNATGNSIDILGNNNTLVFAANKLTTDGGDINVTAGNLAVNVSSTMTLDTGGGSGTAATGGIVDLSNVASISATGIGSSLVINTSGSTNGGNVLLGNADNAFGSYLGQLTVITTGAVTGQLILDNNLAGATSVTTIGTIDLSATEVVLGEETVFEMLGDNQSLKLGPVTTLQPNTNLTLRSFSGVDLDSMNLQGGVLSVSVDTNNNGGLADVFATTGVISAGPLPSMATRRGRTPE